MNKIRQCCVCGHKEDLYTYFCTECGGKTVEIEGVVTSSAAELSKSVALDSQLDNVFEDASQSTDNSWANDNRQMDIQIADEVGYGHSQYQERGQNQKSEMIGKKTSVINIDLNRSSTSDKKRGKPLIICICFAAVVIFAIAVIMRNFNKRADAESYSAEENNRSDIILEDSVYEKDSSNGETNHSEKFDSNLAGETVERHGGYSERALLEAARYHYSVLYGYAPRHVDIDSYNGDEVIIHLYDIVDNHVSTYDWYTIDVYTGTGTDFLDNTIDIMNPNVNADTEYMLPGSDSRYLRISELRGMTADECRIARNELFARHGRLFNDEALQAYFNSKSWYNGTVTPDDFDENVFNEYEFANRDLIVRFEKEQGYR